VVPHLGGVVEDAAGRLLDDLFQGQVFEFGARDQVVQVGHIGLVVLAIVILQGFLGNRGRQRVQIVRQCRKGMCHDESFQSCWFATKGSFPNLRF
jgi:hypothetical protein